MNDSRTLSPVVAKLIDDEHVSLEVEGMSYEVQSMSGRESLSQLFRFDLVCRARATDPSSRELIGKTASILLFDGLASYRTIVGLIAEAHRSVRDEGGAELELVVRPRAYPLTLTRDLRAFVELTFPQVIDRVMAKVNVPYRWELRESYPVHAYTTQYREDDWTFVSRLCEESGIYYWFDHHGGETTLVFSDTSKVAPDLEGGPVIDFALDTGLRAESELIVELAAEAHATPTKFTVGSYDPWNPALKVSASEGSGVHESYDAPGGGPEAPAMCRTIAKRRFEWAMSHRFGVSGNSNTVRAAPGRQLEVVGHPAHDGRYLVTEVTYQARQRQRFATAGHAYQCHLELCPADRVWRAPEATPLAKQAGIQTGRVVGPPGAEIHTDDKGRVRVQMHWDREGGWGHQAGKWLRIAQRGTARSMLYPRVGWNVTAFMEEGDADAPNVLARLHDAEHAPTYSLPEHKTRTVFRTATSPGGGSHNEIRFEDRAGAQEMFLNASKDMNYVVNENAGYSVGRDLTVQIGKNQHWTVGTGLVHGVQHDLTWKVGRNESYDVADTFDLTVNGNETLKIGGNAELECGSNVSHTVTNDRKLEVGGSMSEEATKDKMKLSSRTTEVTIKGSTVHDVGGMYTISAGKKYELTIGAMKKDQCAKDMTVAVTKPWTETTTGNMLLLAGENIMDGSDTITDWTVCNALDGTTQHLFVEAKDQIQLVVGASSITIDPDSVTIRSPLYDVTNAPDIIAKAPVDKHN